MAITSAQKRVVRKVLLAARNRIQIGWCKAVPARRRSGRECGADDPQAVKWDLAAALSLSVRDLVPQKRRDYYEGVAKTAVVKHVAFPQKCRTGVSTTSLNDFNDLASKRAVERLLNLVIDGLTPTPTVLPGIAGKKVRTWAAR